MSEKNILQILAYLIVLFTLFQCSNNSIFEKNNDIQKGNWAIDSVQVFRFEVKDASRRYSFYYNLRNTLQFPFYNLYITYYLEDDKGKVISTELQNITLFESRTGKPFGSGLGDIFTHQLPNPNLLRYKFPKIGKYTFRIKQYMRQDPLPGVLAVGIRVETD
jgi:gliding motility-associated lipoprotein GldH